ncbi:Bioproteinsis of lysosome- organelles complex 1 subunit 6 [Chamberlinius hualienensis]
MTENEGYQSAANVTLRNESLIDELRRNQESLIEALMNENARFEDANATTVITEMFNKVSHYHDKLVAIKKEMVVLHDKTTKLKRRALRLEQLKGKQTCTGQ